MILSLLIVAAGVVPVMLGIGVLTLYGRSRITLSLFFHMLFMGIWQLDIAVLFLSNSFVSEEAILWLFKIFRVGPIFCIPILLLLCYNVLREEELVPGNKTLRRIYTACVNRYTIRYLFVWSFLVYLINLSPLGISGVYQVTDELLSSPFYYPTAGPLGVLVVGHFALYLVTIVLVLGVSVYLKNKMLRRFMLVFTIASLLSYLSALLNLNPDHNLLYSNITVTIYSCLIIFEFIKLYSKIVQEYQKAMERQSKLDHAGNIVSSLIHEMNNAMAIIKGTGQLLPQITQLDSKASEMVYYMNDATLQVESLINNYKEFLKHSNIVLNPSREIMSKVVERSYSLNKTAFERRGATITFDRNEVYGYIDKVYMNQVFTNLMINSLDAMPDEQPNKEIRVEISSIPNAVVVDFRDNGTGIPKDKLEVLFKPFVSTKEKGMGLGLALCEKVMFAHRGSIRVVSSNENGTHFQLILPKDRFS